MKPENGSYIFDAALIPKKYLPLIADVRDLQYY